MLIRTVEELHSARTLPELVDIGEKVHFDNDIDFSANAVHGIVNW